ncbi:MAG: pyridoxal phosphate-dependent aminotransferase [Fibromonadales bacterium]|nr:pyridoxal phosphate-dependent aminotransferase [Fibromonadales bacterium]
MGLTPSPFELKKRSLIKELGPNIVDLTISSPMQAGISFDISGDLHFLAENPDWQFKAPDACGQLCARKAVAAYMQSDEEDIFITSSSSESYSSLFQVFCKKGDAVLTPVPGYPLIDTLAELAELKTHPYFLKPSKDRWEIDLDSLDSAPPNTKILLLIAPHNPTGHIPSKKEFEHILQFCEKNKLALIIDGVFNAYKFENDSQFSILNSQFNPKVPTFILDGLSKAVGLPHIKVGWMQAIANEKKHIYDALEYVLDSQLNCSYLSQALCARVLPRAGEFQKRVIERLKSNQALLGGYFSKMGAEIIPSAGGWYQSFYFPGADDEELCLRLLKEKRILSNPGFLFDFEDGWLVCSLLHEKMDFSILYPDKP